MVTIRPANFEPERKQGVILHIVALLSIVTVGVLILWLAFTRTQGIVFILMMALLLVVFILFPLVGYRAYALLNASYSLERDGLRLKWGLRLEDIPVDTVEWVRLAHESGYTLSLPVFIWPGAVLGHRQVSDLGEVEFIASDTSKLVLISTHKRVFAISPQDPKAFVSSFQRILEMGSLAPIPSRSTRPAVFLRHVWNDRLARRLIPINFGLTLLLWLVTGVMISIHPSFPIGFSPDGTSLPPVPSEQILLLPVMSVFILITNMVMASYFFRKEDARLTAYLLWLGGAISPALLLIAVVLLSFQV